VIINYKQDLPSSILIPENQIFNLENYSQKITFDFFNNFTDIKYWVTKSEPYTKKTNLLEDNSQWEGWAVSLELESLRQIDADKIVKKLYALTPNELEGQGKRKNKKYLNDSQVEGETPNSSFM
jgi:hypothetical protein